MDAYCRKKMPETNYFHVVMACTTPPIVDKAFFVPRQVQRDSFGVIKKHPTMSFNLTEALLETDRLTFMVYRWVTPKVINDSFEKDVASLIMSVKAFLNDNQTALFFHDTTMATRPQIGLKSTCFQRNDVHFHVIIKSHVKTARDLPEFRKLKRKIEKFQGGIIKSQKVKPAFINQVYEYNLPDPEKTFMGTNNAEMLDDLDTVNRDLTSELPQNIAQYLDDDCISKEDEELDNYVRNMPASLKRKPEDCVATTSDHPGVGVEVGDAVEPVPKKTKTDNVHTKKLRIIEDCLKMFPFCTTLDELVKNCAPEPSFSSILQIYAQPGSDKLFSVAKASIVKMNRDQKSMELIANLKVSDEGKLRYMTAEQTLGLFNAWCEEQGINAHELAFVLKTRLNQQATKKIGIYFHGQTGSGKTFWTAGLFTPLKNHVGKLTSGGRFMFQECSGKSIVIGEEVGITQDNVDRFKEMMSGVEIPVEIKNKANGRCHADIVLMNSNVMPGSKVPGELPNLKTRMFIYSNLRTSQILKKATGLPNITFLNLIRDPTEEEVEQLNQNCLAVDGDLKDIKKEFTYKFTGIWEEFEEMMRPEMETPTNRIQSEEKDLLAFAPKGLKPSHGSVILAHLEEKLEENFNEPVFTASGGVGKKWRFENSEDEYFPLAENVEVYRKEDFEPDEEENHYFLKHNHESVSTIYCNYGLQQLISFDVCTFSLKGRMVSSVHFDLSPFVQVSDDAICLDQGPWTYARRQMAADDDSTSEYFDQVVRSLISTGLMLMESGDFTWKVNNDEVSYNKMHPHITDNQEGMEPFDKMAAAMKKIHAVQCLALTHKHQQSLDSDEVDGTQKLLSIQYKKLLDVKNW